MGYAVANPPALLAIAASLGRFLRAAVAMQAAFLVHHRFLGSVGEREEMRGPRDRTASAYLQFPFFVFCLLNFALEVHARCGALICLRRRCKAGRGSTQRSATGFSRRLCARRWNELASS